MAASFANATIDEGLYIYIYVYIYVYIVFIYIAGTSLKSC